MLPSIFLVAAAAFALVNAGTLGLGEKCSTSADCANGADCYAVNSMLIPRCGNFQASCTTDSQCAFNTCDNGSCNGFLALNSTTTSSAPAPTGTNTTVYLPLGSTCNPKSTPCANGAQCWAANSMLIPRCGNFNAACTSDSQCAYNLCNTKTGLCSGFKATSTLSTVGATSTETLSPSCRRA